ncbi:TVP38/TMEM64 family protein [Litchfieldia salsa]|uniref:TVP38/TMEM64 family membrane protein n=1 Tax=Litchfieldia salsa TaxID=930152 RepID=A0A1H0TDA4_9BACI|nr:VTT domain-containing protein [Litchfieldia salsa]SDP52033.1 Uncharacterized membrane protein YdjX, TVP38/TMEM64 family, SNARE-associated domain [Litchfieldia salsa]
MKKWIFIVILYFGLFLLLKQYYNEFLDWINHSTYEQLAWMFFISILLSIFPIIPFTLFAGLMGAKYGLVLGSLVNWVGSVSGALMIYLIAKYSVKSSIEIYLAKYPKLVNLHILIKENAFITLLFARLIPILPPPVITIYSGISRIHIGIYVLATMIGKIPSMILYAYIGNQVLLSYKMIILALLIYSLFLFIVFLNYRRWMNKRTIQHR